MRNTMNHHSRHSLGTDLLLGGLAGAAATWGMGQVTGYLYEREATPVRQREGAARGGATAYETAAEKAAGVVGVQLDPQTRARAGKAVHWALGVGAGALYGALRERIPATRAANGLAFGAGFWLLMDEGANPVLGLTPGPDAFPWQTHARGLAGHLAFGLVLESALRISDQVT